MSPSPVPAARFDDSSFESNRGIVDSLSDVEGYSKVLLLSGQNVLPILLIYQLCHGPYTTVDNKNNEVKRDPSVPRMDQM